MDRKAVSPVIAIVLLLMMTVAAAGAAYFWFSGLSSRIMAKAGEQIETITSGMGVRVTAASTICEKWVTEDLVAAYSFDKGNFNKTYDISGNDNAGSFHGANNGDINGASWSGGKYGGALDFDGSDDWVSVPDDPSLDLNTSAGDELTVSFWVKGPIQTNYPVIIGKGNSTGGVYNTWDFIVGDHDGDGNNDDLRLTHQDGSNEAYAYAYDVFDGNWHHIVGIWTGSTDYMYKDGSQVDSTDSSSLGSSENNDDVEIGSNQEHGDYFNGTLDEVRIYDQALNQTEIKQEMEATRSKSGAVASYSFEKGSGNIAYDTHYRIREGSFGTGMYFDGSDDYVVGPNSEVNFPSDFSIGLWFKSTTSGGKMVNKLGLGGDNKRYSLELGGGQVEAVLADETTGTSVNLQSSDTYNDNSWHYALVAFIEGGISKLYVDGDKVDSVSTGSFDMAGNEEPLHLGRLSERFEDWYKGTIDEVRIYDSALSEFEVEQLYHAGEVTVTVQNIGSEDIPKAKWVGVLKKNGNTLEQDTYISDKLKTDGGWKKLRFRFRKIKQGEKYTLGVKGTSISNTVSCG